MFSDGKIYFAKIGEDLKEKIYLRPDMAIATASSAELPVPERPSP